jgi:hypothetical protein
MCGCNSSIEAQLGGLRSLYVAAPRFTENEWIDAILAFASTRHGNENAAAICRSANGEGRYHWGSNDDGRRTDRTEDHDAPGRHDGARDRRREEAVAKTLTGHVYR